MALGVHTDTKKELNVNKRRLVPNGSRNPHIYGKIPDGEQAQETDSKRLESTQIQTY